MTSYNEIKNSVINDFSYDVNIRRIFRKADSLVEEKDIELFYIKNLFLQDKEFELYLFYNNNRILKIGVEDGKFITTNLLDKNNIEKVTLKENYTKSYEKILEIKFKNGENFKFDSINDTNEYNDLNLASIIEQIFKSLISYKNQNTENDEV